MIQKLDLEEVRPRDNPMYDSRRTVVYEEPIVVDARKRVDTPEVKFWGKIFNKNKLKKPNMVAAIYLRKNGTAEPLYLTSDKGMFVVSGRSYHEDRDCKYILLMGKDRIPFIEIHEEGLIPEPTTFYYRRFKTIDEIIANHQELAIKAIRYAELVRMAGEENKSKINPKLLIVGLIVLIVAGALLKNYL